MSLSGNTGWWSNGFPRPGRHRADVRVENDVTPEGDRLSLTAAELSEVLRDERRLRKLLMTKPAMVVWMGPSATRSRRSKGYPRNDAPQRRPLSTGAGQDSPPPPWSPPSPLELGAQAYHDVR